MKHLFSFTAAAVLLLGIAFTQPAMSQDGKGKGAGKGNMGQVRPNFVDANGDGICDNAGTGACKGNGTGVCDGTGKGAGTGTGTGNGTGVCNGTGQRLRLRDGSCGVTPVAPSTQRKGRSSSK